jgi:hypothetical protein
VDAPIAENISGAPQMEEPANNEPQQNLTVDIEQNKWRNLQTT